MAELALMGGEVLDATGRRRADVLVRQGEVVAVGPGLEPARRAKVLDVSGAVVAPGLVDLHAHLRQPGAEEAETVMSAARAAALGGYTAVVAMPNTEPAVDCAAVAREVLELGRPAPVEVLVAGAITVGRQGEALAAMAEMAELGVRLFTDDGEGVQDPAVMRRAMEYAAGLGVTVADHCEDRSLASGGQMHEGEWSSRLGLAGMPSEAEELMVQRDLVLARLTGACLHLLHLSAAASVELVRRARRQGLAVTAEVTPHHLCLTDEHLAGYQTALKVNPPLRSSADRDALRAGLADGTIDAVATDHAPHPPEAKDRPFDQAAFGMLGLETALPVALGALAQEAQMDLAGVIAALSWKPAAIAGVAGRHGGPIVEGAAANLCVFDPSHSWVVEPGRLASLSRNTAFAGWKLTGKVRHTIYEGELVVEDGEPTR
jgi:dihydroorotase